MKKWDPNNIFTKIINREANADILLENENCIAIKDIQPKGKLHVLIIPKLNCANFSEFVMKSEGKTDYFWNFTQSVIEKYQLNSYKLIANTGSECGQCVFHFHLHLISDDV